MAKKYRVTLTAEEREGLQALLATGKASARQLAHARMLLPVDETETAPGYTDEETAAGLNRSVRTVERVRERFVEQGLPAVLLPKPSTRRYERVFGGASEARLLALACSAPRKARRAGPCVCGSNNWLPYRCSIACRASVCGEH
jgi:hypothetical protein